MMPFIQAVRLYFHATAFNELTLYKRYSPEQVKAHLERIKVMQALGFDIEVRQ